MKKWLKHDVSNDFFLALAGLNWKMRKVFAIVCLIAILGSLLPNIQNTYAYSIPEDSKDVDEDLIDKDKYPTTTDDDFDVNQVELLGEIESMRTENTKTFQRVDGSYVVAMYSDTVHYQKDGKWENINNSLKYDTSDDSYSNLANKFSMKFPKNLDENKSIKLTMGDYSISWSVLDGAKTSIKVSDSVEKSNNMKELSGINQEVSYVNVMNGVDIQYIVTGSKVKENIILNHYIENYSATFQYSVKNLALVEKDGRYSFINDKGEVIFDFSDLYAVDAQGNTTDQVMIIVNEFKKDTYQIVLSLDNNWASKATYPVTIDPTLSSANVSMGIEDGYVYNVYPDTRYSSYSFLQIAYSVDIRLYKTLMKFQLPSALDGKKITYAHLTLSKSTKTVGRELVIYPNTSYWTMNTVSWNNYPSYDNSNIVDYHITGTSDTYIYDISNLVAKWHEGEQTNYGLTLMDIEGSGGTNSVKSMEYTGTTYDPVVEIGYVDSTGLKDYWSYSSYEAGIAGKAYISDYTGLMTLVRDDLSFDTSKQSFGFSMVYNAAKYNTDIGYGAGWQTNYNMIVKYDSNVESYYVIDETGSKEYYHLASYGDLTLDTDLSSYAGAYGSFFICEDGSGSVLILRSTTQGVISGFYVFTADYTLYKFFTTGFNTWYLSEIVSGFEQTNPISITIERDATYKEHINRIIDDSGNYLYFQYNLSNYLSKVTLYLLVGFDGYFDPIYNELQKVEYEYTWISATSKYALASVSYCSDYLNDGWPQTSDQIVQYGYDASGKMNNAEGSDQNELSWINTAFGKMDEITIRFNEGIYSTVTYEYTYHKTVISDQDNNWVIKKFDSFGHTVNISSSDGNTTAYEYLNIFKSDDVNGVIQLLDGTPNYKNNHKLVTASEPQQSDLNPVSNSGFEYYNGYSSIQNWTYSSIYGSHYYGASYTSCHGLYALGMSTATNPAVGYFYQTITLDKGSYTLSAYVKKTSPTPTSGSVYAEIVGATMASVSQKADNNGDWQLIQQYFTVANNSTNVSIRLYTNGYSTTGYFDSIQIKEGFITNKYQMLENASFEYTTGYEVPGWNIHGSGVSRVTNTYDETFYSDILGTYGIKIDGNPNDLQYVSIMRDFILDEESTGGEVTIGAWAKSEGTPMTGMGSDTNDRAFQIHVMTFEMETETSGSLYGDYLIRFDPTVEGWQYNFGAIPIGPTIDCMMISVEYQGEGYVWFDGIQITYEPAYNYYEYDEQGRLSKLIQSNGDVIEYIYGSTNDDDRVPIEVYKNGNLEVSIESEWNQFTSITANNIEIVTDPNENGQTESVSVAGVTMSSTTYVASAFKQYIDTVTDEFGNETKYHNDIMTGLLKAIENAKGQDTHYIYNDKGQLISVESKTDYANANEDPLACVIYGYNEIDQLDQIIMGCDANSSYYYEIGYDIYGRMDTVTVLTDSSSFELINYLYEDGGGLLSDNVGSQTYGNLDYLEFDYYETNRMSEVRYYDSNNALQKKYGYAYDSLGNLTVYSEYSSIGTVLDRQFYQYNSSGQLVKIVDKDSNEIRFEYGSNGLLGLSILIDGNTIESNYNIDISGIIQSSSFSFMNIPIGSISRDYETTGLMRLEGNLLVMTINQLNTGSVATHFGYDTNSSRVNSVTIDIGQDEDNDYVITYEYDELGNITLIQYLDGLNIIKSFEYTYDSLNRLSTEDILLVNESYSNLYRYDSNGNIIGVLKYEYNQIPTFVLNSSDFPVNEDYLIASKTYEYSTEWLDQLESYVTMDDIEHNFTYDNQGNPLIITNFDFRGITYNHAHLTWFGRQLTSISVENENNQVLATLSYSYNDQGYRTKKIITVGSVIETYVYELLTSTVYFEKYTNSSNASLNYEISYLIDTGNEIIGFVYNDDAYYYLKDIQGNILSVVDNTGAILVQYEYDAFGNLINNPSGTIANINPYTYRGYRTDSETNMYYLNSRYYSPEMSRFISSDGLLGEFGDIQFTNMYAYCVNNPVMNIDPSGFLLKTINEYSSDGSGSIYVSGYHTTEDLYNYYLNSEHWIYQGFDTYNDGYRQGTMILLFALGLGVGGYVYSGYKILGISIGVLSSIGSGLISITDFAIGLSTDTNWASESFVNIHSGITVTFWTNYYFKDGVIEELMYISYRPYGLKQD